MFSGWALTLHCTSDQARAGSELPSMGRCFLGKKNTRQALRRPCNCSLPAPPSASEARIRRPGRAQARPGSSRVPSAPRLPDPFPENHQTPQGPTASKSPPPRARVSPSWAAPWGLQQEWWPENRASEPGPGRPGLESETAPQAHRWGPQWDEDGASHLAVGTEWTQTQMGVGCGGWGTAGASP